MRTNYLEHYKCWSEYMQAVDDVKAVIDEYILVFQKTQPKAQVYGDKVQSGMPANKVEEYVIEMENRHIRERIADAQRALQVKKELLDLTEQDLRKSKDVYDVIYVCKYIDKLKPKELYKRLDFMGISYSRSAMYRAIKRIDAQVRF